MSKRDVVQRVDHYLKTHHFEGLTVEIVERSVKEDDGWWYVPIRPSSQGAITYNYYGVLADIEGELKENEHLDVLLVPSA